MRGFPERNTSAVAGEGGVSAEDGGRRGLLVAFSLGHMANDWAPSTIWIVAPAIAASMDLSPAEVGLLITLVSVGGALGYLPAGILADRVADRGRLLLATFWWVAAGYFVAAFAPGFWSAAMSTVCISSSESSSSTSNEPIAGRMRPPLPCTPG